MSSVVKWLRYDMVGAPVVQNSFGDMIAMFDACLVNGFNPKTITGLTRSGTVATATVGAAHGYLVDQVALVSGADQTEYNGEQRITAITSTTISFTVASSAVTPATGAALSVKVAPLGWQKVFTATNRAAYRSLNALSNKPYLYVNNSQSSTWVAGRGIDCVVEMCESMADIDTATNRVPRDATTTRTDGWYHWYQARGTGSKTATNQGTYNKQWVLVGDDRTFYLMSNPYNSMGRQLWGFGDFISFRPGDLYNAFLAASENYNDDQVYSGNPFGLTGSMYQNGVGNNNTNGNAVQRPYHGSVGWANFSLWGLASGNSGSGYYTSGFNQSTGYPNTADNGMILSPRYLYESGTYRGQLPGVYFTPLQQPHPDATVIDNVNGFTGRKFLCVATDAINGSSNTGSAPSVSNARWYFDITGPWQ